MQRDHLAAKLADVENRLSEAKADKRQSERDRKMAKAAADLKKEIPGVFACVRSSWGDLVFSQCDRARQRRQLIPDDRSFLKRHTHTHTIFTHTQACTAACLSWAASPRAATTWR